MTYPTLDRRALLLGFAAFPLAGSALAGPALAQDANTAAAAAAAAAAAKQTVARAVAYLEGLDQARARFVQTDQRGAISRGWVYLKRPGKARFAYDPPSGLLVVSNGSTVSVSDSRLKTFDSYPLAMTPLSLFLARNIRLDRGVNIVSLRRMAGGFSVIARDGEKKTAGQITLDFTDAPLALIGWTVADAQGRTTRVQLQALERVDNLSADLFQLKDPRPRTARAPM